MREVPVKFEVMDIIQEYISERNNNPYKDSEYLILGQRGAIQIDAVDKILEKHTVMGSFEMKLKPYAFRHSFCTKLINKGIPITTVSKLAGHSSIETTAKFYINSSIEDVIRLYFPDNEEKHSYVVSSSHYSYPDADQSKRSDPAVKSISTKYGKEIVMSPGSVEIIGNGNLLMRLTDDGGIEVNSDKSIVLDAGGDINISGGGKVTITGDAGISLTQAGANMTIQDDVTMSGGKVNIQS